MAAILTKLSKVIFRVTWIPEELSVEFPTEVIQVKLQEQLVHLIVNGSNAASAASYDDIHPRQISLDHRSRITFNMLFISLEVLFGVYVRGKTVRDDDRSLVNVFTYYLVQRISTQIVNHKHLHVVGDFSDALPFRLFSKFAHFPYGLLRCLRQVLQQYGVNRFAFNDNKCFGLCSSCTALDFLTMRLFRKPYREECLGEFHFIRQLVYGEYRFSMMFLSFVIMSRTGSYCTLQSLLENVSV